MPSDAYFDAIAREILTAINPPLSLMEQEGGEDLHTCHAIVQQGFLILLKKELASRGKTEALDTHVTHVAVAFLDAMLGMTACAPDAIAMVDDCLREMIPNYEAFLVQAAWHIRHAFLTTWRHRYRASSSCTLAQEP